MSVKKEDIGFIGAGLMGHGMAKNILAAGYRLSVIAHSKRAPIDALVDQGATEAATLADLAANSSIIHICAPGFPQVEAIVAALLPVMQPGTVIIDCSTSDPNSTVSLTAKLEVSGFHMADAPLGGTPVQAEAGELSTMIGAPEAIFERIKPVKQCFDDNLKHCGPRLCRVSVLEDCDELVCSKSKFSYCVEVILG